MSTKYPLIEGLGLKVETTFNERPPRKTVDADDLEALLAKGQEVHGRGEAWTPNLCKDDTHSALLINIREIPKKVKREDFDLVFAIQDAVTRYEQAGELYKRILDHGIE